MYCSLVVYGPSLALNQGWIHKFEYMQKILSFIIMS